MHKNIQTHVHAGPHYLHHDDQITVQLVERMQNVAGTSAIIDTNAATVSVGSNHVNTTAQWHLDEINKWHSATLQDIGELSDYCYHVFQFPCYWPHRSTSSTT